MITIKDLNMIKKEFGNSFFLIQSKNSDIKVQKSITLDKMLNGRFCDCNINDAIQNIIKKFATKRNINVNHNIKYNQFIYNFIIDYIGLCTITIDPKYNMSAIVFDNDQYIALLMPIKK